MGVQLNDSFGGTVIGSLAVPPWHRPAFHNVQRAASRKEVVGGGCETCIIGDTIQMAAIGLLLDVIVLEEEN
jgi:hypothetical protein